MSRLSPPTRLRASTVCQAVLLTVASATLWVLALVFVGGIVAEFALNQVFEGQRHTFTFRKGGLPVWRIDSYRQGQVTKTEYQDLDGNLVEMTNKDERSQWIALVDARIATQHKRAAWRADAVPVNSSHDDAWFFEDFGTRGQFTLFNSRSKQRIGWIGLHGFSSTPLSVEQQFPTRSGNERAGFVGDDEDRVMDLQLAITSFKPSFVQYGRGKLLIEPGGRRVHWIDLQGRFSRVIHDGEPVLAANFDWVTDLRMESVRIVLRTQDALHVVSPTATPNVVETLRLPESVRHSALLQWERTPDGPLFVEPLFTEGWKLTWATPEGSVIRERIVPQRDITAGGEEQGAWLTPLIQLPVFGDFMLWAMAHQEDVESSPIDHRRARELGLALASQRTDVDLNKFVAPVAVLHLSVALWSVLAVRRLRRFGASIGEQIFWGVWMLAFGLPGYLAFRVSRTWPAFALGERGGVSPPVASAMMVERSVTDRNHRGADAAPLAKNARGGFACLGQWLDVAQERAFSVLERVGLQSGHAALVVKELRLAAVGGAAACGAYLLVIAKLTNVTGFGWMRTFVQESGLIPFLSDGFAQPFSVVTFLMAVGLAVWQTSSESRGGAWLFLLHRPVSRRAIVFSKLVVGLSVLLVCSALPIILYGTWAARPGTHASPFEWGMTNETWRLWWSMPPVYLGTLLAMLRPARWFGTRLLPCAAGLWWIANRHAYNVAFWPTWLEGGALLAIDLIFIACLLLVAREREYP